MKHCNLAVYVTTALLMLCVIFQKCSSSEFFSMDEEPINFPPNDTPPSVEPFFCTNNEEDCKLDIINGVEIKATWKLKIKNTRTSFSAEGYYTIPGKVFDTFEVSVKVDGSENKVDNGDDFVNPYIVATVTTTGTLQDDTLEVGNVGSLILSIQALFGPEDFETWEFGHDFEVA